jgi:hypothetical protein
MVSIEHAIWRVRTRLQQVGLVGEPECYSVSEAVYLLAGGKASGLRVMRVPEDKTTNHWFLVGPGGELFDLTAGQFDGEYPDYRKAKRAAFYPRTSTLAKSLMIAPEDVTIDGS